MLRYSKSVCILKVLYITGIMHQRMPLAQLLTFAWHNSRERGEGSTGDSGCVRNPEASLFAKRKKAKLPQKKATTPDP